MLNQINPKKEDIVIWYKTWKTYFPPDIVQHPAIDEQLMRALDIISRLVGLDSTPIPTAVPAGNQPPLPPPIFDVAPLASCVPLVEPLVAVGFREVVEFQCAQKDILFVPLANKEQCGRPVFRVGNVLSYFERQTGFVMSPNGSWVPVSAQQLVDMAVTP